MPPAEATKRFNGPLGPGAPDPENRKVGFFRFFRYFPIFSGVQVQERPGELGEAREMPGNAGERPRAPGRVLGSSRELQGAPGSSGEPCRAARSHREQRGAT